MVDELNIKDRVIFTGYLSEKELINMYKYSRGLIYASFYEGFGYPPLEAMRYGCPVIASNTSSLPEVVGSAGIYINPYSVDSIVDGINKCLKLDDTSNLIKEMKDEVEKFSGTNEVF